MAKYGNCTCVLVLLLGAGGSAAHAQEIHPELSDTHSFILGAHFQSSGTEVGARSNIDLSDLGVDDDDISWMLAYRWRFTDRWTLSAGASDFQVDGDVTVSDTFEFDGKEFEAGVSLESDFSVETYIVDLMYRVYKTDRAELLLGGGVHALNFDVEFKGTLFLEDESRSETVSGDDLLAPLPNLRMHGFYALTPNWAVNGTLGWMSANIDDWDGRYVYANLRTDYRFGSHFGIGLGYQYVDVDVSHERSRLDSSFDVNYHGPTLYLVYGF